MKDCTDIIAILDRSGSMDLLKTDTEGGFNALVKEQQEIPGECTMNLYQFDDRYEVVYENRPIAKVPSLNLVPRGMTALLDAVGKTIVTRGEYYASLPEDQRPSRVIVVIMTDGAENSSHEYTTERIKALITTQQDVYNWQFIFLGANIDSFAVAGGLGIRASTTLDFAASHDGIHASYASVSRSLSAYRKCSDTSAGLQAFTDEDRSAAADTQ